MIVGKECFIGIDKSIPMGCIIPASEVVQAGFLIIDIPTIAERIANAERVRKRTGRAQRLAPCIVLVFYYEVAGVVKNADDIALEILNVSIDRAIEANLYKLGLCIVKEVEPVLLGNLIPIIVIHCHVGE